MPKFRALPPLAVVAGTFSYDPETGLLAPRGIRRNWTAGPRSGRSTVRINGHRYTVARVCWLLGTEQDPGDLEIDHINRDPFDNRLSNLRLATRSQQLANRSRTSTTPLPKGVYRNRNRSTFHASWGDSGEKKSAGGFRTAEEAHLFYLWQTRHHGDFADPLPISACPPPPRQASRDRRRHNTASLPKGVSRVMRRRRDGTRYLDGYQTSFTDKQDRAVTRKGFRTPEEAHDYYLANRK